MVEMGRRVAASARLLPIFTEVRKIRVEIEGARERWGIRPEVRLPPAHLPLPYPKGDPERAREWVNEMHSFRLAFVSDNWRYQRATDWDSFFGACLLYDPTDLELARFAEYGGTKAGGGGRPMKGDVTRRRGRA